MIYTCIYTLSIYIEGDRFISLLYVGHYAFVALFNMLCVRTILHTYVSDLCRLLRISIDWSNLCMHLRQAEMNLMTDFIIKLSGA